MRGWVCQNFRKSLESARPTLRLLVRRKGESWEEKYGFGTDSMDRKRKGGLGSILLMPSGQGQRANPRRNYSISQPEDFRQVAPLPPPPPSSSLPTCTGFFNLCTSDFE